MDKEEIKYYLKIVDELETKLTGEDKETYAWLIYGYNQCAKLLNETEDQCKKQKEVIDEACQCIKDFLCSEEYINVDGDAIANNYKNILNILKGERNG